MTTADQSSPSAPRRLLGLVMIVKNEVGRIENALHAYLDTGLVDEATILDTGSTDGTPDVVRRAIAAGAAVRLFEEPFVDFATSRNRALDLHGDRTDFVLMVNVDRIEGGPALRAFLEAHRDRVDLGAFRLRLQPGHYFQASILRAGAGWRYVGRTHEVAIGPLGGPWMGPVIPGVSVIVDRADRPPEAWAARWRRDVALLAQDKIERPEDPRPVFYLGQTHECLAMLTGVEEASQIGHLRAAARAYAQRSKMEGYRDETYEALFRYARVTTALEAIDPDPDPDLRPGHGRVIVRYLAAHTFDPRRAEPLCALAEYLQSRGDHALAYMMSRRAAELPLPSTDLFVDDSAYTHRASDLAAVSAFYLRNIDPCAYAIGSMHMRRAIAASPDDPRIQQNLALYDAIDAKTRETEIPGGNSHDTMPTAGPSDPPRP
jgi:hypothetical protein